MGPLLRKVRWVFWSGVIVLALLAVGEPRKGWFGQPTTAKYTDGAEEHATMALSPFIDVHTHPSPSDPAGAVEPALRTMRAENAAMIVFLPPPFSVESRNRYDYDVLRAAEKAHRDVLAFGGGGGTLNIMIQQAVRAGEVSPNLEKKFKARAEEILREGAVAFGEMAMEHFATAAGTYYEYAPPDHRLFLLLADISAQHGGIPIDLHMEAVPSAMRLPPGLKSPPNPARLGANIFAFERLLAHNPRATIVWAHAGCDYTGYRTPLLMRRLLKAHPNLYMQIKVDPMRPGYNSPLTDGGSGSIKPQWLQLLQDFPDRFVLGSDQHYPPPSKAPQRWQSDVILLNQLPPDLRRKIGWENAERIYHLPARTFRTDMSAGQDP